MEREDKCKVAILDGQLIGYWDCQPDLCMDKSSPQALLTNILNAPVRDITETAVGVSASGLMLESWVKWQDNNLILGREAFGRMPLYWTQVGEIVWFASHLRLLLGVIDRDRASIDLAAFYGYSCFSYVPTPLTPISGIQAVPAGSQACLQLIDGKISQIQIEDRASIDRWRSHTPAAAQLKDEIVAISQLQALLQSAVERQIADLPHQEPVGVFLSGGLDSAIVAALLVRNGIKVRAYTLDFGAEGISEQPYAEQVAQHLHIPLTKVPVTAKLVRKSIDLTARALDLPYGDGVTVPLYLLCEAAKPEVSIVFNGEGGDQLFAGWTNKPTIAASIYGVNTDFNQHYLQTFHRLYNYEPQAFQSPIASKIQSLNPTDWIATALDPHIAPELLDRLRRASLMLKGAQNIHPRATNLAGWHQLQVRSIFCDLPLAEWTFGVAGTLYLQGACEKYILKRAVEDLLPAEIVWRSKRGMGVPLTAWLLGGLWADLGTWLNPQVLQQGGYWQPDIAARLASGKFGGAIQGRRIGEILWLIIVWERWRVNVLGVEPSKSTWRHPFWISHPLWRSMQSYLDRHFESI